jgi:uncharacterized OsmC-like protein
MVEATSIYEGTLRCSATHGPSGSAIETDAPTDNHGRGERFSPTDLVATALGTCMLTTMGIFAARHDADMTGSRVRVVKEMTSEAPRRIARITTEISMTLPGDHPQRELLEKVALSCPVHLSLHPEVAKPVTITWL